MGIKHIFLIINGIMALTAIFISIKAIGENNRIKKSDNLIEIRKLFNETDRKETHTQLRGNYAINDWVALDDYIGTFELCYVLILQKNLDLNYFKQQYGYRIINLLLNDEVVFHKLICEWESWENFYNIVDMLYPEIKIEKLKNISIFLNKNYKKLHLREDSEMNVVLNILSEADRNKLYEILKDVQGHFIT